ncbi:ribosomal maturation YjgA family protein [Metabacillus schmidteae]|uniref:ribosomal maturation YjgA family protein n=1 Tax=Metabacillus schmidteae TaxID=2730405 RepID=UPI001F48BCB4|nr:DUF2809 domain-containing protein [Metabacillus schmidteae]
MNNIHYKMICTKRIFYFISLIVTIILGVASRKYSTFLVEFVALNAGDMLWAMMVYFGLRFLLVNKSLLIAVLLSFLFSFGIEISQFYQAGWLNQNRDTLLGGLILGKGFLFVDLIRYSVGIIFAFFIDRLSSVIHSRILN